MRDSRCEGAALVRVLSEPKSIAVVGASAEVGSIAARPLAYLTRGKYAGRVVAVNPRETSVAGVRCLASVDELEPDEAEVALLAVPAALVSGALASLAARGTKAAIAIASGFEASNSGPALRHDLGTVLANSGIRLIGPNCVGVMNPHSGAHLNFSSVLLEGEVREGGVALITQSGALGNGIVQSVLRRGAGLRTWVSTGDEVDAGALEVLCGTVGAEHVKVVGMFLEAFTDLEWLDRAAEAIERTGTPVFALKAARTDAGRRAASGHTGRVVGATETSSAVLRRLGIVEVDTLSELADVLVSADILRRPRGRSVTVVTVSGGSGVIAADQARTVGLSLTNLESSPAAARIAELVPGADLQNPLDVPILGRTAVFGSVIVELADPRVSNALVAVESSLAHDRDELVSQLTAGGSRKVGVPVVLTHLTEDDPLPEPLVEQLARCGIAVAPSPERAVSMIASLVDKGPARVTPVEDEVPPKVLGFTATLEALGGAIPHARTAAVSSLDQAVAAARTMGYPVVLKASGAAVVHRTELGLVRTGLSEALLRETYEPLARAAQAYGETLILQEQVPGGVELLVSVFRDPEFGAVAMVRAGGVLTELLDAQVLLPGVWTAAMRASELHMSKIGRLLEGYRGASAYDSDAVLRLVETLLTKFGRGNLNMVELNPVIVHQTGVTVVDALASVGADRGNTESY